MDSAIVRLAAKHDVESLLKIPAYSKCVVAFPFEEEILVAERDGKVLGAISVVHKDITYVSGEWNEGYESSLNTLMEKVSGCWISKLYVFPEYRLKGIGTKLVEETVKYLNEKGLTEAYSGIYIRNDFRNISQHIFEKCGFKKFGSCICSLTEGYCRGILFKRLITSSEGKT